MDSNGNSVQSFDPVTSTIKSVISDAGAPVRQDDIELPKKGQTPFTQSLMSNKDLLDQSGITGDRLAMFTAQLAHESNGFKNTTELPSQYASSQSDYKGRGWIQLTGQANYQDMSNKLGIDLVNNPEQATDPDTAMKVAIQYWNDHKLNDKADAGDFDAITQAINGGQNGAGSRYTWLNKVNDAMSRYKNVADAMDSLQQTPQETQPNLFDAKGEKVLAQYQGAGRLPVNTWDYLQNSLHVAAQGTQRGNYKAVADQLDPVLDKMATITGQRPDIGVTSTWDRLSKSQSLMGDPIQDLGQRFNQALSDLHSRFPDANVGVKDFSDVLNKAAKDMSDRQKEVDDQASQVSLLPKIGGMIAGAAGWMSDPMNALLSTGSAAAMTALAPEFAAGWLGTAAVTGLSTALTTVVQQPVLQSEHETLGQPHGTTEALKETAEAGLGGAIGGAVLWPIGKAISGALGSIFPKKNIIDIKEGLNAGKGEELAQLMGGSDGAAIQRISDALKENPSGSSMEDLPGLVLKTDKVYTDIMQGNTPSPLPQGIVGVKGDIPASPLDEHIIAHLDQEGFADAGKVSDYLTTVRKARGDAGDLTPEEWAKLPLPEHEVPTALQRITEGRQEQQLKLSEAAKDLPTSAANADATLQAKLSQWGETPEIQTNKMNYKIQQLTDRKNKYDALLKADEDYQAGNTSTSPWTETKGYETKIANSGMEEADAQARRHTLRQLEADKAEILGLNELKKSVGTTPAETVDLDVNRMNQLRVDLPNAQSVLLNKMDLAGNQLKGLEGRISDNARQSTIYKEQLNDLKSGMVEASEGVEKWAAQQQAYPIKQMVDELARDTKAATAHQARLKDQLQEHSSNLKELNDYVPKFVGETDGSILSKAESLVQRIKEDAGHENTRYPMQSDQFGKASEVGSMPKMVQDTAEKYSALKALKDCIG